MIKDARNNGRKKWVHRPAWCDWQRAFRLQYLLLNKRVLMQFIKSQHEEDTFSAHCHICLNSGDLPQRHTVYDSTAVFMFIVDQKVEQVCKNNWSLWILVCDVTMSITNLHGLSVDFEKTHHVFPTNRPNPQPEGFFSPKNFPFAIIGNFGSSVICPPFRNMGEGDERPGPLSYRPHSHGPPPLTHPFGDPGLEMRIGMVIVEIVEVVVFFWQFFVAELNWNMKFCEMETACFELCERAIFFLRRQRRKRRTKQALHWTVSWHQRTDKQMVHPRCLMAHPAIAWNVRQLATPSVAKQHGAFDSLYVKCLGCKACK